MPTDSTNRTIRVGDWVRWRGQRYQIKAFHPGEGRFGTARIEFQQMPHLPEVPDEVSVDYLGPEQE